MEVYAGEKAHKQFNDWLPQEAIDAMQEFRVSIKGSLTTPVGGHIRENSAIGIKPMSEFGS